MRILFIGTVRSSAEALERLIELKADVVGIITMDSDRLNADYADLMPIAAAHRIPVHLTENVNDAESLTFVRQHQPDVIFCIGWSRLLKQAFLESARLGCIGYHPTLLPYNRGRHPIIWTLALGLSETGSSFFKMTEAADEGPIVSQRVVPVTPEDTAKSLYDKLMAVMLEQLPELLSEDHLLTCYQKQVVSAKGNVWRKRSRSDGRIDWRMPAAGIYNLVRALSEPYPGAEAVYGDEWIRIDQVRVSPEEGLIQDEPGKIIDIKPDQTIVVKCGDGAIHILEPRLGHRVKDKDYFI